MSAADSDRFETILSRTIGTPMIATTAPLSQSQIVNHVTIVILANPITRFLSPLLDAPFVRELRRGAGSSSARLAPRFSSRFDCSTPLRP